MSSETIAIVKNINRQSQVSNIKLPNLIKKNKVVTLSHNLKVGRQEQKCLVSAQLASPAPSRGAVTWAEGSRATATFLALGSDTDSGIISQNWASILQPVSQASCLGPKGSLMPGYKTWGNPHSWSLRDRKHFQLRITNTMFSMTKRPVTDSLDKLRILFGKRENVLSHLWMLLVTNITLLPSPYSISLSLNALS